jgi:hypothetical protein
MVGTNAPKMPATTHAVRWSARSKCRKSKPSNFARLKRFRPWRCRAPDFIGRAWEYERAVQKILYDVDNVSQTLGRRSVAPMRRRIACVGDRVERCLLLRTDEAAVNQCRQLPLEPSLGIATQQQIAGPVEQRARADGCKDVDPGIKSQIELVEYVFFVADDVGPGLLRPNCRRGIVGFRSLRTASARSDA